MQKPHTTFKSTMSSREPSHYCFFFWFYKWRYRYFCLACFSSSCCIQGMEMTRVMEAGHSESTKFRWWGSFLHVQHSKSRHDWVIAILECDGDRIYFLAWDQRIRMRTYENLLTCRFMGGFVNVARSVQHAVAWELCECNLKKNRAAIAGNLVTRMHPRRDNRRRNYSVFCSVCSTGEWQGQARAAVENVKDVYNVSNGWVRLRTTITLLQSIMGLKI
jgi:hypothetical protein